MSTTLLALAALLASAQEPARDPELARMLVEDVRAWSRAAELPSAEDVQALVDESTELVSAELAAELGQLGHRLFQVGRRDEGRALVAHAGELAARAGDVATHAWALDWLGQDAWVQNDLERAIGLLAAAAAADERRRAPLDQVRHLADVARIRLTQGRFDEAFAHIALAEEAARRAGSDAAAREAAEVHGSLLFELGLHREALELCMRPPEDGEPPHDATQVRLDVLASDVLADVGRLESALGFARRAHDVAREPAVREAAPLLHLEAELGLGLLLGDLGRCDEALALLDETAREFERLGDARGAAWCVKNRGYALFAAGRHAEALAALEEAWHAGERLGVPFLEGIGALGVAEVLGLDSGERADESRLHAALAAAERVGAGLHDRQFAWRCAVLRARLLLGRGDDAGALEELRGAVTLVERWRRRLGASGLVEHALRLRSDPCRDAAFVAARLGRMEEALGFAGLLQARVLDELQARRDGPLPRDAPELDALRTRVGRLEFAAKSGQASAEDVERAEGELDAALLARDLDGGRTLSSRPERFPLARLGPALAAQGLDTALVFVSGGSETLVLRVDARDSALHGSLVPIGRAALGELVARLRAPFARLETGALDLAHLGFDVAAARALHDALLRPLALPPNARIALIADGAVAAVPFELLVASGESGALDFATPFEHLGGLRFFGDEHALASFGSLARLLRPAHARDGAAVVFLAPDAIGVAHGAAEARAIEHALGGARVVHDARPLDVARESAGAALLHFAAHGRIDAARPAHGHLLLGGGEGGAAARLESWQAAELDLDGARVVLSACHSGLGAWRDGAGLAGLTSGFLLGGAREVVASRWAVDDRVTARFMEHFYAALAAGADAPEALRAARTRLRDETDERGFALAHPAFWAAWFVQR